MIAIPDGYKLPDGLERLLLNAIQQRVETLATEEIYRATKRLEAAIPEIVSGVAISVLKHAKMEVMGTELVIRISLKEENVRNKNTSG